MQLRAEVQLTTMIKAMREVIIPALDANNQLAMEQARLVEGMLDLMARQLPLQYQFDRDELRRLIDTAADLAALSNEDATGLAMARQSAAATYEQSKVDPAALYLAVRNMREAICAVIDHVNGDATITDAAILAETDAIILKMSREQLLRDRALLVSQNWELRPADLPPVENLVSDQSGISSF